MSASLKWIVLAMLGGIAFFGLPMPSASASASTSVVVTTTYDALVTLYDHSVQPAGESSGAVSLRGSSTKPASATGRDLRSLKSSRVAANAGTKLGWSVGDDIYSLTKAGNMPAWSTVRGRFWKNEAASPQIDNWSAANLDRMKRGLAPQRFNRDMGDLESMELSHEPIPYRDGGTNVIPRWPQDHASVDPFRRPGY